MTHLSFEESHPLIFNSVKTSTCKLYRNQERLSSPFASYHYCFTSSTTPHGHFRIKPRRYVAKLGAWASLKAPHNIQLKFADSLFRMVSLPVCCFTMIMQDKLGRMLLLSSYVKVTSTSRMLWRHFSST